MQTELISRRVPIEIRWLLATAALLLPPALRSDWLREWYAEFWHCLGSDREMRARAFGAFPDAWFLLRHDYGIVWRIRDISDSRSAPVVALVLLIAAAAWVAGGFKQGRNLLFHQDSAGLVLVAQPIPFMGGSSRVPAAQVEAWLQRSQTVAQLGSWSAEDRLLDGRHVRVCRADAAARVLLAEAPVMPQCDRIESVEPNVISHAGVVARLKNGASMLEAERELAETAKLHKGWIRPAIVPLSTVRTAPLAPVGSALLGLLLMGGLAIRARTIRAWIWAASKIVLSFALIAGVWIEFVARAPFTETAGIPPAWSALVYLLPVLVGCWAAFCFRRNASHRCRICYRPLTMPVSVGMPGRCLFEPGGTEYLCGAGHGALLVSPFPELMNREVWATWPDSWA